MSSNSIRDKTTHNNNKEKRKKFGKKKTSNCYREGGGKLGATVEPIFGKNFPQKSGVVILTISLSISKDRTTEPYKGSKEGLWEEGIVI